MDLDDVTLEPRTRELVRVALSESPLLESDSERVKAARRLIRHAGWEVGAKVRTVHVKHVGAVMGFVDREPSEDELLELVECAFPPLDVRPAP
jgi:hypothetical protein